MYWRSIFEHETSNFRKTIIFLALIRTRQIAAGYFHSKSTVEDEKSPSMQMAHTDYIDFLLRFTELTWSRQLSDVITSSVRAECVVMCPVYSPLWGEGNLSVILPNITLLQKFRLSAPARALKETFTLGSASSWRASPPGNGDSPAC